MKGTKLYIKIDQNIEVTNKKVYMEDLGTFYSSDNKLLRDLKRQVVKVIDSKTEMKYCFSIMKVIETILKLYPELEIINLGETEFILSYSPPKKVNKLFEYTKTIFVGLIIFFGGAFSIMTFNADSSVVDIFDKIYELVTGSSKTTWSVVELGYCVGIPVGILVFFNHFSRKKTTSDPTPIQIEMRKYETDVNSALIQNASREGKTIDAN